VVRQRGQAALLLAVVPALATLAGCECGEVRIDWPYPRYDLANTAANPTVKCRLLEEPAELWTVALPEGEVSLSLYPVAADIDNDGRAEYVIGAGSQAPDYWLYAFNVEDGSILWRRPVEDRFYWSAPIVSDVNKDGKLDIVLGTDTQVMALNGYDATTIWQRPFGGGGMGMTVADLNDDGWVEVVINDYGDPKRIHLLNGQDGSTIWSRETGGSAYNVPTVADIDSDGRAEVLSHSHLYDPSRERLLVWDHQGNELWAYAGSPSEEQAANAPPELGWVPDFGYIATTVGDFDADGEMEIGWGTRCHYYLLNSIGDLVWRVPMVEGYGVVVTHREDGTVEADIHGTGGPSGFAAGVGNLDADSSLEIVLSFGPEYRLDWDEGSWDPDTLVPTRLRPANQVRAFDGRDGSLEWVFEGEHLQDDRTDHMGEPILVDLTGDGLLDVLALSTSTYLYAIRGTDGEQLMAYRVEGEDVPTSVGSHLTFVADGRQGIILYTALVYSGSDEAGSSEESVLKALRISNDCE
jgi:outer membrane protein assembly factor BamB